MIFKQEIGEKSLFIRGATVKEEMTFRSGVCEERGDYKKIYTGTSLELPEEYYYTLFQNHSDIIDVAKRESIKVEEADFNLNIYIKMHCEKIAVNDVMDERRFGYIKLIYESSAQKYVDEIPLTESNIIAKIEESKKRNLQYISKIHDNNFEVKKGEYPVIFSSRASGYFCHEILGHLLEQDNYVYSRNFMENGNIPNSFDVIDSVEGVEEIIGLNKYDDEGQSIKPITIISNGRIENLISLQKGNRSESSGNARRENYLKSVMPRMRNTILVGKDDVVYSQLFSEEKELIYVSDIYSGSVSIIDGKYFLYGRGWRVVDGEKRNAICNLTVRGNTLKDLSNMIYIGRDCQTITGECSKYGNIVRVGMTGPIVFFSHLNIEGEVYGRK